MKTCLYILVATLIVSCIYDPPKKGKEIIIENQTDKFVYVTDTLPSDGYPILYDSFSVNNRLYISSKANNVSKYNKWIYFFSDEVFEKKKKNHVDSIKFYFIKENNFNKSFNEIVSQKLYNVVSINNEEIQKQALNYIFYYPDSIRLMHIYNLKTLLKN